MNQPQLDNIRENASAVVNQYSSGYVDAMLRGTEQIGDLFEHCLRLHYLWGILNEVRLSGTTLYVGDTAISGDDVEDVYSKIWHYNGIFADVDLSNYSDITADDGDGGTTDGDSSSGISSDHYRSNDVTSVVGTNVVTFSSPLASADYTVTVYNTGASGYLQKNLVVSTKTANGFVCGDVLEAGTLTYFAVLDL